MKVDIHAKYPNQKKYSGTISGLTRRMRYNCCRISWIKNKQRQSVATVLIWLGNQRNGRNGRIWPWHAAAVT